MRAIMVLIFLAITSINTAAASSVYVNDVLRVGIRDEPASGAKTISVVKTGEVLEILDSSEPKYYKVKTPAGRIGWVSRTYVRNDKPAFMQIKAVRAELASLKKKYQAIDGQFSKVQESNLSHELVISSLKEENVQLQSELDDLNADSLIPKKYQTITWSVVTLVLLLLGFFIGGRRVHNQVRHRLGGLDI